MSNEHKPGEVVGNTAEIAAFFEELRRTGEAVVSDAVAKAFAECGGFKIKGMANGTFKVIPRKKKGEVPWFHLEVRNINPK